MSLRIFVLLLTSILWAPWGQVRADSVVILGDSHSQALGPLLAEEYERRGHDAVYVAHAGWSSHSYRRRSQSLRGLGRVDLAVVVLGGNNRIRDAEEYSQDVSWVLAQLRTRGARKILWFGPLWCTAPGYQGRHASTRALQRSLFVDRDVVWYDLYESTRSYQLRPDGVHFTYRAYIRIVQDIFVPTLFP